MEASASATQATRRRQADHRRMQATRQGWPYYIRRLHKRHSLLVYSRATPGGWPVAGWPASGGGLWRGGLHPAVAWEVEMGALATQDAFDGVFQYVLGAGFGEVG